jgi:hypothetical protein
MSSAQLSELKKQIKDLLENGFIHPIVHHLRDNNHFCIKEGWYSEDVCGLSIA